MCQKVVQSQIPECPRYAGVFPRDYPNRIEGISQLRGPKLAKHFPIVQGHLTTFHLCHNLTDPRCSCLVDMVGALK